MLKINAASRLLVTAEGEWFYSLPDEMQKQYIEEHPESKYAKDYKHGGDNPSIPGPQTAPNDPQSPQNQPKVQTPMGAPGRLQRPPAQLVKPRPQLPKKTEEALKHVPKPVGKALKNGGMKPKSKERMEIAEKLKAKTPRLARGMLKDTMGAAKGLASTYNIVVKGKPEQGDFKKVASMFGTILGSSVMAAAIGTTGPVGFLAFMAVKHMAAPALYRMAQKAFHPPPEPDSYGYWADEDTWVDMPKAEWEKLTDKEADRRFKEGQKKKALEKHGHGYWDKGQWHAQPRAEWEQDFNKRGPGKRSDIGKQGASVVTATDEEKQMTQLLETLFDFVENGDIPKEAIERAVYEMADAQIARDREHEKEQQLQRQEHENSRD
jgi:hypothetical protein